MGDFADEVVFGLSEMIEGLLECWPLDVIVVLGIPVEFFSTFGNHLWLLLPTVNVGGGNTEYPPC